MLVLKYQLYNKVNIGTEENPQYHESWNNVTMTWSEANEEIAKKEAYLGQYTIEDDGQPEPDPTPQEDTDAMLVDHELRLTMLELGVI